MKTRIIFVKIFSLPTLLANLISILNLKYILPATLFNTFLASSSNLDLTNPILLLYLSLLFGRMTFRIYPSFLKKFQISTVLALTGILATKIVADALAFIFLTFLLLTVCHSYFLISIDSPSKLLNRAQINAST